MNKGGKIAMVAENLLIDVISFLKKV